MLSTMEGKKILTINWNVDQYIGFHVYFAWMTYRDLQWHPETKAAFDMYRLAVLGAELNGQPPDRRRFQRLKKE